MSKPISWCILEPEHCIFSKREDANLNFNFIISSSEKWCKERREFNVCLKICRKMYKQGEKRKHKLHLHHKTVYPDIIKFLIHIGQMYTYRNSRKSRWKKEKNSFVYKPFFPELKTMSWMLSRTTTLTGSLLASGIGSDLMNGFTSPSCHHLKGKPDKMQLIFAEVSIDKPGVCSSNSKDIWTNTYKNHYTRVCQYRIVFHPRCNLIRLYVCFEIFLPIIFLYNKQRCLFRLKSKVLPCINKVILTCQVWSGQKKRKKKTKKMCKEKMTTWKAFWVESTSPNIKLMPFPL